MDKEEQLIAAAEKDDFKTVKALLLKDRLNVNIAGEHWRTTLHYAVKYYGDWQKMAQRERMEIIDLLVRYGANVTIPDDSGESALDYAIKYNHLDVVEFLSTSAPRCSR